MNGNGTQMSTSCSIIGRSPAMRRALELVVRFAPTDIPILLVGETGTGKELFAQEIHRLSSRPGELVDVNCGAIPRDLLEGELFGHRRGAFTGAVSDQRGLIVESDRGTLFLDELLSLPLEGQAKLLRVLESGYVRRLGGPKRRHVRLRVVAAALDDLQRQVDTGGLRHDLFQRLAGVVISLPPLRARGVDVVSLARNFLSTSGHDLSDSAVPVLMQYRWPGNVRELHAALRRAVHLGSEVDAETVAQAIALGAFGTPLGPGGTVAASHQDREALLELAYHFQGNVPAMCSHLGVSQATIYRWAKAHGISFREVARSSPPRGMEEMQAG